MMALDELRRAALITEDEHGNPMIIIPRDTWEAYLITIETSSEAEHQSTNAKSQMQEVLDIIRSWDEHPEDDLPEACEKDFVELGVTIENWKQVQ
ncbi:MAG: hypothetical protein SF029_00590 [bacterium]|nr:hypothetical protein [bacterium]